ncbi:uncharacterized protein LY79DRAFT_334466 [Colletotrichum navitas]|uniref:Uncharacterized protein n=1 Tax=Colletotrichum navitas TaxID=681940 RepID=A0AAD8PTE7_9PEZI|nr:uncharacterized protein LY79DRAFT_334466 [Colletotrichum navitas]KAK1579764.1 hypothetical protein LY79DRAFT_334466 [Colletotrichum navitas]
MYPCTHVPMLIFPCTCPALPFPSLPYSHYPRSFLLQCECPRLSQQLSRSFQFTKLPHLGPLT